MFNAKMTFRMEILEVFPGYLQAFPMAVLVFPFYGSQLENRGEDLLIYGNRMFDGLMYCYVLNFCYNVQYFNAG